VKTNVTSRISLVFMIFAICAIGAVSYLGYQYSLIKKEKISLEMELEKLKADFASTTQKLSNDIEEFRNLLITTQGEKVNAEQNARNLEGALDGMTNTLGLYQKLTTTDREVLSKYSKVYFLNENYTPKYLTPIPPKYIYDQTNERMISSDVLPFLQKMLDDAETFGIDIKIASAFRSFSTQGILKSAYKVTYGSGANKFSADQGYSEHQLGTTLDFTTAKLGANFGSFVNTTSYLWLTENAYKYGFILSYPKNNSFYMFEPWHWRFVGKGLALRLHDEKRNFYDMEQRDINEYLLTLFNQ